MVLLNNSLSSALLFFIDKSCCVSSLLVKNIEAFTRGRDAQPNDAVQQSDIDQAAKSLIDTQTSQEQASLNAQVQSNEQVVSGSNKRQPTVTPDNPVDIQAKMVTLTVSPFVLRFTPL